MIIPFTRSTEVKMAYSEKDIIDIINYIPLRNGNFIKSKDPYQHYDAENLEDIVEIKIRSKKYDYQIIERYKYLRNLEECKKSNREFWYVVNYENYLSVWNINDLVDTGYKFNWHVRDLVKTSEFEDQEPIPKIVGYLDPRRAAHINFKSWPKKI